MTFSVRKISGHTEAFDSKKFTRSLQKAGANKELIAQLLQEIEQDKNLRSTRKIYQYALDRLYKSNPSTAARYNIKQSLFQLGPAGFPFELFVAEIFKAEGYQVESNQVIAGYCIDHEVDIIAHKGESHFMIECKYHNRQRLKTDVKATLYTKARFDDVEKAWKNDTHNLHQSWIVTNTKFTSQAIKYATCVNIQLLSWNYPGNNSLIDLIQKHNLHPITSLVGLSKQDKQAFVKHGLVLCRDAHKHEQTLKAMGVHPSKIKKIIQEAKAVCKP